jgi:hypothetical protein
MTQYAEFMEDYLEPVDKNKCGRYHSLLGEVIYPFNLDYLGRRCGVVEREMNTHIYEGPKQPDYHWWVYFDNFSMWSKYDMAGR